jgi:predicted permease
MLFVLGQMAVLILCGMGWRLLRPLGLDADSLRQGLTGLVFALLLPALVLLVLWRAPLGLDTLWIAGVAAAMVLLGAGLGKLFYSFLNKPRAIVGTLVLAAGWPNATYLGLPVLEQTLGTWARSVAVQYDLFACTPLLLTLGILLARSHGDTEYRENPLVALIKVPPLWAALLGVALNLSGVPLNPWFEGVLEKLALTVPPLMLIALGMGLRWDTLHWGQLLLLAPVVLIQLLLLPVVALLMVGWAGLSPELQAAVTLEAAMPTMVLGVVLCDRYKLDAGLYAAAVFVTTLSSLITLPLWFEWLSPLIGGS